MASTPTAIIMLKESFGARGRATIILWRHRAWNYAENDKLINNMAGMLFAADSGISLECV